MRFRKTLLTACLAGVVALPVFGASERDQLQSIADEARVAETDAGRLDSFTNDGLAWQSQGQVLMELKEEVNQLARNIHAVEGSGMLPPAEQRLSARAAERVKQMVANTEGAIVIGRESHGYPWKLEYQRNVSQLYANSESLQHETQDALDFVNHREGD
jgi:hypothetical protein